MLDELNNCDPEEISVNRILVAVETGTAHDGDDSTLGDLQWVTASDDMGP